MKKLWIVTEEFNMYDQMGAYFIAAYIDKPDFNTLKKLLPEEEDVTIGKLTKGGGRRGHEDNWYNLEEVEEGQRA